MKRILHVSYSMDTGGGPLTIKRIIEDFQGYEYYVSGNKGVFMTYFESKLPAEKILPLRGPNLLMNVILLVRFCKKHSIDILHVHGRGAASFSRFVKWFIPKIKVVYTPNGFFPDSLGPFMRRAYILGEKLLFRLTDVVFFVSKSEEKTFSDALRIPLGNKKFFYIQNYLNTKTTDYNRHLPFEHKNANAIHFLFIGRLSMQKGVDILVESLRMVDLKDVEISIIGYGEMEEYLKTELGKGDLPSVNFIGKMNEAFRLMPVFDALLLPFRFEGLPFTVLEAMYYKLPLIVTPCQGTKDLVGPGNGYVSEHIDASSYAKVVERFLSDFRNNKQKIEALNDANFKLLATEYSPEAVAQKIEILYS